MPRSARGTRDLRELGPSMPRSARGTRDWRELGPWDDERPPNSSRPSEGSDEIAPESARAAAPLKSARRPRTNARVSLRPASSRPIWDARAQQTLAPLKVCVRSDPTSTQVIRLPKGTSIVVWRSEDMPDGSVRGFVKLAGGMKPIGWVTLARSDGTCLVTQPVAAATPSDSPADMLAQPHPEEEGQVASRSPRAAPLLTGAANGHASSTERGYVEARSPRNGERTAAATPRVGLDDDGSSRTHASEGRRPATARRDRPVRLDAPPEHAESRSKAAMAIQCSFRKKRARSELALRRSERASVGRGELAAARSVAQAARAEAEAARKQMAAARRDAAAARREAAEARAIVEELDPAAAAAAPAAAATRQQQHQPQDDDDEEEEDAFTTSRPNRRSTADALFADACARGPERPHAVLRELVALVGASIDACFHAAAGALPAGGVTAPAILGMLADDLHRYSSCAKVGGGASGDEVPPWHPQAEHAMQGKLATVDAAPSRELCDAGCSPRPVPPGMDAIARVASFMPLERVEVLVTREAAIAVQRVRRGQQVRRRQQRQRREQQELLARQRHSATQVQRMARGMLQRRPAAGLLQLEVVRSSDAQGTQRPLVRLTIVPTSASAAEEIRKSRAEEWAFVREACERRARAEELKREAEARTVERLKAKVAQMGGVWQGVSKAREDLAAKKKQLEEEEKARALAKAAEEEHALREVAEHAERQEEIARLLVEAREAAAAAAAREAEMAAKAAALEKDLAAKQIAEEKSKKLAAVAALARSESFSAKKAMTEAAARVAEAAESFKKKKGEAESAAKKEEAADDPEITRKSAVGYWSKLITDDDESEEGLEKRLRQIFDDIDLGTKDTSPQRPPSFACNLWLRSLAPVAPLLRFDDCSLPIPVCATPLAGRWRWHVGS